MRCFGFTENFVNQNNIHTNKVVQGTDKRSFGLREVFIDQKNSHAYTVFK